MIDLLIFFIGGISAGILGGYLGIGGGIIIIPLLYFVFGLSPAFAVGTCILAVFFTTLGGSIRHYKLGHVNISSLLPIIIAGVVSTVAFSFLFLYFTKREEWLNLGLGLVFTFISVRMIIEVMLFKKENSKSNGNRLQGSLFQKTAIGSVAGIPPGIFGIGTGAILVPAFHHILKAPIKIAIGSSLTCFAFCAFVSAAIKILQGFVIFDVAIPICLGTFIGSNIGAILNKRTTPRILKLMFGIAFLYVSLKYIFTFFGVHI
ncbi:MAG: sulfite exporter TauE/SafE family protein [Bacteroidetes bacterium]|nr:sulfite exporter TauE/SafE family protein [Bacteroidota bacterium]